MPDIEEEIDLPIQRLVILDKLLKQRLTVQIDKLLLNKVFLYDCSLGWIKLPSKVFSSALIETNRNNLLRTSGFSIFFLGYESIFSLTIGAEEGSGAYLGNIAKLINQNIYLQAALLCKPILDFMVGIGKRRGKNNLHPKEAQALISGKMHLHVSRLEGRIFPPEALSTNHIDTNEVVKLLEADFPGIYKEYAAATLEAVISTIPRTMPGH